MNIKKLKGMIAAILTFIIIGLIAIQAMYYIKGYPPETNMLKHQFLSSIGLLIGIIAASYIYTYIQGEK